ncbi:hypothetical protein 13AC503A_gene0052 [Aeromonas phage 13AC503A]|nr:hypothetical protein 13AC503A_gene0052 [Aeromonas phage 13AC503A]
MGLPDALCRFLGLGHSVGYLPLSDVGSAALAPPPPRSQQRTG